MCKATDMYLNKNKFFMITTLYFRKGFSSTHKYLLLTMIKSSNVFLGYTVI